MHKKRLQSIPKKFQGIYINKTKDFTDTLYIEENRFVNQEIFEEQIPIERLESSSYLEIKDGLLYNKSFPYEEGVKFNIYNDTLFYKKVFLISNYLSDSIILKNFNNIHVLNIKDNRRDYWDVYLIELVGNDNLKIYGVKDFLYMDHKDKKVKVDKKIEEFYDITAFKQIKKNEFLINPTKKEFKKLVDSDLFEEKRNYKKIANT